jgi:hypothetical protein
VTSKPHFSRSTSLDYFPPVGRCVRVRASRFRGTVASATCWKICKIKLLRFVRDIYVQVGNSRRSWIGSRDGALCPPSTRSSRRLLPRVGRARTPLLASRGHCEEFLCEICCATLFVFRGVGFDGTPCHIVFIRKKRGRPLRDLSRGNYRVRTIRPLF